MWANYTLDPKYKKFEEQPLAKELEKRHIENDPNYLNKKLKRKPMIVPIIIESNNIYAFETKADLDKFEISYIRYEK